MVAAGALQHKTGSQKLCNEGEKDALHRLRDYAIDAARGAQLTSSHD